LIGDNILDEKVPGREEICIIEGKVMAEEKSALETLLSDFFVSFEICPS